jgi:hypothetical protein
VFGVGTVSTLRSWLSMWSLRTSQCTAAPHLAQITRLLRWSSTPRRTPASIPATPALYDALAAPDKTLEFIKADHSPARARRRASPGRRRIAAWVGSRA